MQRTQLSYRIIELTADMSGLLEQAAGLLLEGFRNRTEEWQDLDSARREVIASLAPEKLSRVAVDPSGQLLGWIGGIPMYRGLVWELHPLVVAGPHRRRGIGRALVEDFDRMVATRGGLTVWLGGDDENDETSVSGVDVYADVPDAIRHFRKLRGEHPAEFYFRLGFRIVGLIPDANGRGKPDILFARRVGG